MTEALFDGDQEGARLQWYFHLDQSAYSPEVRVLLVTVIGTGHAEVRVETERTITSCANLPGLHRFFEELAATRP